MIRILLDPQTFITQEFGGISRYFTELYTYFDNEAQVHTLFPLLYTDNIHYKESRFFENSYQSKHAFLIRYSKLLRPYLPRKLKKKSKEKAIDLLKKQEFDLFVPTYYDAYFLDYIKDKPFVLTVHDMIHELYPQYFTDDPATASNKKILIEHATKIIAISENTKKDILKFNPNIDAAKIEVVYLGQNIKDEPALELNVPEKYILFVGNRTLYKNFIFFIKAIGPILIEKRDLFVVCAGGNPFNNEEELLIHKLGIANRVLQQNFKDAELTSYYRKALCFVFPSAYEGFGIPVLEAMACGCPIVLTNNSSFPEVAGEAGIYFELDNSDDLKNKVNYVLENAEIREQYRAKGIAQANKFTWNKTATETLKVYELAISKSVNY